MYTIFQNSSIYALVIYSFVIIIRKAFAISVFDASCPYIFESNDARTKGKLSTMVSTSYGILLLPFVRILTYPIHD